MKVHGATDTENLAILSWKLTTASVADTLVLPDLLQGIRLPILEVFADAGYLSSKNAQLIQSRGATPYIKPKKTTKGRPKPGEKDNPASRTSEAFRTMIERYQNHNAAWMHKYGKRNCVESAWSGLKRRFGHAVGAFSERMRRIEAALRILAWNLTRVTRT